MISLVMKNSSQVSAVKNQTILMLLLIPVVLSANALATQEENTGASPELQPDPGLSPEEVVQIQTEALGNNDHPYPDAGIEITFRFASPQNKLSTGPLPRFIGIVRGPVYGLMINHAGAEFGPAHIDGNVAQVPVLITTPDGKRAGYVFRLSHQLQAPYEQCWMTDSVVRMPLKNPNRGVEL